MTHQEYQDLLGLHALDALEASDAATLDQHLSTCQQCRAELDELRDAAALLAHTPTPFEPSENVRTRVLASIQTSSNKTSQPAARVVDLSSRRRVPTSSGFMRMAASILIAALLIGIVVLWRRDARLQRELAGLSRELSARQRELTRDRDALEKEREALAMLTAPNMKRMELGGSASIAENARGTFVLDPKTGHALLLTAGLPATPPDKAYELWFIADGRKMPGKVFSVDPSGRAMISDQVPLEARERGVFAITLEPKDGVTSPTGAIYLISNSL